SMGANVAWLFAARTPERIERLVIEDTAPPLAGHAYPVPPEQSPEPVDFDWNVARQIVGQLNDPDPAWWDGPAKVTIPTLLISGSANNSLLYDVRAKLPAGQLIEIDVGHHVHQTAPTDYNDAVEAFLGDP
ncbi:MAG: alpha/beta hydrolase, partial [Actinomycetia bacterium]|nr:alpha/beta hydrolase [Actinomycetes bacterium]